MARLGTAVYCRIPHRAAPRRAAEHRDRHRHCHQVAFELDANCPVSPPAVRLSDVALDRQRRVVDIALTTAGAQYSFEHCIEPHDVEGTPTTPTYPPHTPRTPDMTHTFMHALAFTLVARAEEVGAGVRIWETRRRESSAPTCFPGGLSIPAGWVFTRLYVMGFTAAMNYRTA